LVTQEILEEFLVRYDKVVDLEKEKKRFGMIHHELAVATVLDYDLSITPQQYSKSIMPMYYKK
nr:bifunctional riboflavin kinase/FMN phosphatase-like [Tanacetum cinerariifolium]